MHLNVPDCTHFSCFILVFSGVAASDYLSHQKPSRSPENSTFSSVFTVSHTREIQPSWYKSRFVNFDFDGLFSFPGRSGTLIIGIARKHWEK